MKQIFLIRARAAALKEKTTQANTSATRKVAALRAAVVMMLAAVILVAAVYPHTEAQAAAKHRGLTPGLGGVGGSYTNSNPELEDDETEFRFNGGLSFGYIGDYFFGDNTRSAFHFDYYGQSASARGEGQIVASDDEPPTRYACSSSGNCRTQLSHNINLSSFVLGYRYHFSGAAENSGYLGIGGMIRFMVVQSNRIVDNQPSSSGFLIFPSSRDSGEYSTFGPRTQNRFTYALTGGYDWNVERKKRNNNLLMGIHLMYTPVLDYGDIKELGGLMLGYTIGGATN